MVPMTSPKPKEVEIWDPPPAPQASSGSSFSHPRGAVAASEFVRREHPTVLTDKKPRDHFPRNMLRDFGFDFDFERAPAAS